MRRMYSPLLLTALLALLLSGCGASSAESGESDASAAAPGSPSVSFQESTPVDTDSAEPQPTAASPKPVGSSMDQGPDAELKQAAKDVVDMLRDRDLARLAEIIDPGKGLRFSPYSHIDADSGRLFKAGELPTFKDANKLSWGSYDGSGEPIELTFRDYFEKFVYDQDYAAASDINVNKLLGVGNAAFNGQKLFPDASFVEFYFPGSAKKNNGMDWESLVLVFRPAGSDWKLCAIVHGQWTI